MLYEVKLYVEKSDTHFVKVDEEGLEEIRNGLSNDTAPDFIEVWCFDGECSFGINRNKVTAYEYKEVTE